MWPCMIAGNQQLPGSSARCFFFRKQCGQTHAGYTCCPASGLPSLGVSHICIYANASEQSQCRHKHRRRHRHKQGTDTEQTQTRHRHRHAVRSFGMRVLCCSSCVLNCRLRTNRIIACPIWRMMFLRASIDTVNTNDLFSATN